MGGMSSSFGGLGDAMQGVTDVAAVAAAPETGGLSLAALAPAAISTAGSIAGGLIGQQGVQDQISAAQQNQAAANAFSAQQYATRYQTTVKDLQAAGLNPMLAATTGAGTAPTAQAAPTFNKSAPLANAISGASEKAIGAANTAIDTQAKDVGITNTISQIGVNDANRKYIAANTSNVEADTILKILEAPNVSQKTKLLAAQTLAAHAQAGASSAMEAASRMDTLIRKTGDLPEAIEKGKQFGKFFDPLTQKRVESGINTAVNAVNIAKPKPRVMYQPNITNNY
jgi:hypothetical protein